jgi:ribosomal protein S14
VGGLISVSPPEEHERRTFCRRCGNPRTCDCGSAIDSKEAFADNFQKLYERCQQCVVKDGDYFEGQ